MRLNRYKRGNFSSWLKLLVAGHAGDTKAEKRAAELCSSLSSNPQMHKIAGNGGSVHAAMAGVVSSYFVGLVEHFDASLCLLASLMQNASARIFDSHCQCPDDAARNAHLASHKTHGSSASSVVLTETDRTLIAQLT